MRSATLQSAAKINLTLEITGTSGKMHTLDMLCCAVDLFELVTLKEQPHIELVCNRADIPTDEKNVAFKAAQAFFAATGIKGGVFIDIEKSVPVGAGMGGGSADAAAVLVGLNAMHNHPLTQERLCEVGLSVGSDVPVCILGGLCRVQGTGGELTPMDMGPVADLCFVATMSGEAVSTAKAYGDYDAMNCERYADTQKAITALNSGKIQNLFEHLKNDLQLSSTLPVEQVVAEFVEHGAQVGRLTGSGAVVYGVFTSESTAKNAIEMSDKECFLLKPVNFGVKILAMNE